MTFKEYMKIIIVLMIPMLIGIFLGALVITYIIHSNIARYITCTIFAVFYTFGIFKYIDFIDKYTNIEL